MEKHNPHIGFVLVLLVGLLIFAAFGSDFGYGFLQGPNNRNVTIDTTVNITNSLPEVQTVRIEGGATNITLNAGTTKLITCNATVRDYNGGSTIVNITATFYNNVSANHGTADDMNYHYTNGSCFLGDYDTYTRNVSCSFPVQYFANSGYWKCNVTAIDPYTFNVNVSTYNKTWNFNTTHIDQLLALNVTPTIDYGNLSVGDTSLPQPANVTNLGNRDINISVRGFNNVSYISNNAGLVCDFGNISINSEKYNLVGGIDLGQYQNLSHVSTQIPALTIVQQQNDTQQVINTTYWILYVPPNPFGRCNGTVIFQAERAA